VLGFFEADALREVVGGGHAQEGVVLGFDRGDHSGADQVEAGGLLDEVIVVQYLFDLGVKLVGPLGP
jgi:hypothetical protein